MKNLKITNLSEKDIQNLKQIKIIELKEMELQDLKILKIKIETAIENIEKEPKIGSFCYIYFFYNFSEYFLIINKKASVFLLLTFENISFTSSNSSSDNLIESLEFLFSPVGFLPTFQFGLSPFFRLLGFVMLSPYQINYCGYYNHCYKKNYFFF